MDNVGWIWDNINVNACLDQKKPHRVKLVAAWISDDGEASLCIAATFETTTYRVPESNSLGYSWKINRIKMLPAQSRLDPESTLGKMVMGAMFGKMANVAAYYLMPLWEHRE